MNNLEFSVPYNGELDTLTELFRLKNTGNNKIREIYLSGPQEYSGAGRAGSVRTIKKIDLNQFLEIVDRIHTEGLRVNLVLNSTCEGSEWYSPNILNKTLDYIRLVHMEHGVEAVTIANPLIIKEVRKRCPDIEICASVLADIDCVQRAVIYSQAGANVITPDVNINRDLNLLKSIKDATHAEIRLMVNEGCLYKCPFRKFHFNYISHKSKEMQIEDSTFSNTCFKITASDHSQILKSCWIRPEDTKKYREITKYFKIVGRSIPGSKVIRTVKAYMIENWDGDLFDIMCSNLSNYGLQVGASLNNKSLDGYKFFEHITSCDRNCNQCNYCRDLAEKLVKIGEYTKGELEDLGFADIIGKNLEDMNLDDLVELSN